MGGVQLGVRGLGEGEVELAFGLLRRVAAHLEQAGRRQRISNTRLATYQRWQAAGANYAVFEHDRVVGILSLPREPLDDWPELRIEGPVVWLRALATDPACKGRGVGGLAIRTALELVAGEPLYLDCVSGFLPDYYASFGFEPIARKIHPDPDQGDFDITLMRHDNGAAGAGAR